MRDWMKLLEVDARKNEEINEIIKKIKSFSIEELEKMDIKKDIKKRLVKLKEQNFEGEIILSQRERIEKCISFSYNEDFEGEIYLWNNSVNFFDISGDGSIYEILHNQPFWISKEKNLIKMDTILHTSINSKIYNNLIFMEKGNRAYYNDISNRHKIAIFNVSGGEIITIE